MSLAVRNKIAQKKMLKWRIVTVFQNYHTPPTEIVYVFKNASSYLYFAHGATAVCCSNAMHELHIEGGCCRYPYWHRSDIIQSQSDTELQWRARLSSWGIHLSICSGIYPEGWGTNSKTPVQTVKMTLNDSLARQQESLRLISGNISEILRSSYARTPTQTRAHWQFEFLYAFGCI